MTESTQSAILGPDGRPFLRVREARTMVRAGFDSASASHPDNVRHWTNADALSPNNAANADVRKVLRNRARYECKNNSYCRGMVSTLANDTVGRGPRLQMRSRESQQNKDIEAAWTQWTRDVRLAAKLRQMRLAKAVDGEALVLLVENPRLPLVTLDLRLLECDYLASPAAYLYETENRVDGVELNEIGLPYRYYILDTHPGASDGAMLPTEGSWYPASRVIHYFYADRAGQARGVPEITPALDLYAILRRYTLATLGAAETAADVAGILKSPAPPDAAAQAVDPFLPINFERRSLLTMPMGWDMQQLRSEQPTTAYSDFKHEIINEIARCLHMPFNVAAGNSSNYNYASGRLDHQLYFRVIEIERNNLEVEMLSRVFSLWLMEYLLVTRGTRPRTFRMDDWPHGWVWDGFRHADPAKEANAVNTLWQTGLLTDYQYLMREGYDPEEHYEQLEEQNERRRRLKLPLPGVAQQMIEVDDEDKEPVPEQ
jgi:lambda family phage portal protein